MAESLTLTKEWMELLDGIADTEERWRVLSSVFAFSNTDNAKKEDFAKDLTPIGECVFMSICERLMKRKRDNRYITNQRKKTADIRRKKTPTFDAKNADIRRSDDLFDLSSNQHIDTFKPLSSLSNDKGCFPHGEKRPKKTVFKIPTVEEVREYCQYRRNAVNPEQFHAFYEARGWLVGKTKMKDWKAAVRYWEQKMYEDRKTLSQKRDYSGI